MHALGNIADWLTRWNDALGWTVPGSVDLVPLFVEALQATSAAVG